MNKIRKTEKKQKNEDVWKTTAGPWQCPQRDTPWRTKGRSQSPLLVCTLSLLWVDEVIADVTASESHAHQERGDKSPCLAFNPTLLDKRGSFTASFSGVLSSLVLMGLK